MNDRSSEFAPTEQLENSVRLLQSVIALFLVFVLVIGVVSLLATFFRATLAVELLGCRNAIPLISTTIGIVPTRSP